MSEGGTPQLEDDDVSDLVRRHLEGFEREEVAPTPAARRAGLAALLPNAVTLTNALCGFGAVIALSGWTPDRGYLPVAVASWLMVGAWICDMVDGSLARVLGATGRFGAALDSLCDVVGFGVAPAFLVGTLASAVGWPAFVSWGSGMALLACVLVRLARFDAEDVQDSGPDGHLYFRGLPSPAVGMVVAALGLTFAQAAREIALGLGGIPEAGMDSRMGLVYYMGWLAPWLGLLVAALAVTVVRYPDLPKHYAKGLAPRWHLAVVAAVALYLGFGPALLGFFLLYALLGPLSGRRRRVARRA